MSFQGGREKPTSELNYPLFASVFRVRVVVFKAHTTRRENEGGVVLLQEYASGCLAGGVKITPVVINYRGVAGLPICASS